MKARDPYVVPRAVNLLSGLVNLWEHPVLTTHLLAFSVSAICVSVALLKVVINSSWEIDEVSILRPVCDS